MSQITSSSSPAIPYLLTVSSPGFSLPAASHTQSAINLEDLVSRYIFSGSSGGKKDKDKDQGTGESSDKGAAPAQAPAPAPVKSPDAGAGESPKSDAP